MLERLGGMVYEALRYALTHPDRLYAGLCIANYGLKIREYGKLEPDQRTRDKAIVTLLPLFADTLFIKRDWLRKVYTFQNPESNNHT